MARYLETFTAAFVALVVAFSLSGCGEREELGGGFVCTLELRVGFQLRVGPVTEDHVVVIEPPGGSPLRLVADELPWEDSQAWEQCLADGHCAYDPEVHGSCRLPQTQGCYDIATQSISWIDWGTSGTFRYAVLSRAANRTLHSETVEVPFTGCHPVTQARTVDLDAIPGDP